MKSFSFKKVVVASATLLGALLIIAGCGNNKSGSSNGKVTLTFWRQESDPEVKTMNKLIKEFESKNPNIKVDMKVKVDYETAIRTALAGGTAPDVMNIDGPTLASYASSKAIIPLDKYVNKNGAKEDVLEPVVNGLTYKNKMYAMPLNDASLAMLYNKKLFKQAGVAEPSQDPAQAWTWQQTLDAAKKITNKQAGVFGWSPSMGIPSGEGQVFSLLPMIWQAGGEALDKKITTADGYLNSKESLKALNFLHSLSYGENVAPKEDLQEGFANGKVGIIVAGPWEIARLKGAFPDFKLGEDFGVAPMWRETLQVTPNGSWNMAITSQSKNPAEAWKFINYVTGKEGSKVWYQGTGNLPARYSTMKTKSLESYPMNIYVAQAQKFAKARPVTPKYAKVSQALGDLFEDLMVKDVNVKTRTNQAVSEINEALKAD